MCRVTKATAVHDVVCSFSLTFFCLWQLLLRKREERLGILPLPFLIVIIIFMPSFSFLYLRHHLVGCDSLAVVRPQTNIQNSYLSAFYNHLSVILLSLPSLVRSLVFSLPLDCCSLYSHSRRQRGEKRRPALPQWNRKIPNQPHNYFVRRTL